MANLLKYSQIICEPQEKRVINSNELIAEKTMANKDTETQITTVTE